MRMSSMISRKSFAGSTIIEVIVSVFLLTFGILALMAAQIRSVASISEAENRTLIAQAAETLAEGMQINPTITSTNVSYSLYTTKPTVATSGVKFQGLESITTNTAAKLAEFQLINFQAALDKIPNVAFIDYVICQDKKDPDEPTTSGSAIAGNCAKSNLVPGAVIKVVWQMKSRSNGASNVNQTTTYTYMLKVRG